MRWVARALGKYAVFSGRARRKEYWYFMLFVVVVSVCLSVIEVSAFGSGEGIGSRPLSAIFLLAIILPYLGVTVRRLHDIGRSGWWLLISLVPIIGNVVLFVFAVLPGTKGSNVYGSDPTTEP